jgi:hydrogenase-4 component F
MYIILIVLVSAVSALACLLMRSYRTLTIAAVLGAFSVFILSFLAIGVWFGFLPGSTSGLKFDGFGAILLALIAVVQLLAVASGIPYLKAEIEEGTATLSQARWYGALIPLFVISMVLAVSVDSLGLMWIAVEGTTLATTMLVAFYTKGGSLEAAWKYILVCSAGIAVGLIGILLLYYSAFLSSGGIESVSVTWTSLLAAAKLLPPAVVKLAFVFIFIGFGTKVGIVPMHTWLPDAHGRTPSPVSGMLSGVLLSVALLVIYRAKTIVDIVLGAPDWTNNFFIVFGALSVAASVCFMVRQKNYKRLLAYSSIEHMGFAVFALGFGPAGVPFAMVQIIGHALLKSALFFGTGNILIAYKSTKFDKVSAVAKYLPRLSALFVMALIMLLAVPPSPLFFSELGIFSLGFAAHPAVSAVVLLALVIAAGSFFMNFMPMFFVAREKALPAHETFERWNAVHTAMVIGLVLAAAFGLLLVFGSAQEAIGRIVSII